SALRRHGRTLDGWAKWKTKTSNMDPAEANSFLLGVMLDRGVKWKWAWAAGKWMYDSLSDWDNRGVRTVWRALSRMEARRLRGFLRYGYGGYAFHKNHKVFARLLPRAAKHVLDEYGGDPRRIWNNQRNVKLVME